MILVLVVVGLPLARRLARRASRDVDALFRARATLADERLVVVVVVVIGDDRRVRRRVVIGDDRARRRPRRR
jgi:hypothetical protein|tara:strand:+ start:15377 stop:15592 length:216 start_codon:yes stop_codon:yes gene_type:complete